MNVVLQQHEGPQLNLHQLYLHLINAERQARNPLISLTIQGPSTKVYCSKDQMLAPHAMQDQPDCRWN